MYYIVYLCYIKWLCTLRNGAFPFYSANKKQTEEEMYATRQFHLYTYVVFIVYEISLRQIIAVCHTIL